MQESLPARRMTRHQEADFAPTAATSASHRSVPLERGPQVTHDAILSDAVEGCEVQRWEERQCDPAGVGGADPQLGADPGRCR